MTTKQSLPKARRLAAVLATLALGFATLAGCSGQAEEKPAEGRSPLDTYLAAIHAGGHGRFAGFPEEGTPAEQRAYNAQVQRKTEELVAQCMSKAGFEYAPDTRTTQEVGGSDGIRVEPDDRDWVAAYGYGLIDGPGEPTEERPIGPDPNQPYLSSLSDAERAAYDQALWGTGPTPDADGEDGYTWKDQGCQGWAGHELDGESLEESGEFNQLADAIARFEETSPSDPGYAALDAAWASCMNQAGYSGFQKQQEARASVFEVMNAYNENDDGSNPDFGTARDPDYVKLARSVEIPLALADLDCREKTAYQQQHQQVQYALEQQFIDDHKAELDAAVERFRQGR